MPEHFTVAIEPSECYLFCGFGVFVCFVFVLFWFFLFCGQNILKAPLVHIWKQGCLLVTTSAPKCWASQKHWRLGGNLDLLYDVRSLEACWKSGLQNASRAGGWPSMAQCLERRHKKLEGNESMGPWRLATFTCNVQQSSEVWWWVFCLKWALYLCLWGCQLDFIDQILMVHHTMLAMSMNGPEVVSQGMVVRSVNHQDRLGWKARDSKLRCPYASSM